MKSNNFAGLAGVTSRALNLVVDSRGQKSVYHQICSHSSTGRTWHSIIKRKAQCTLKVTADSLYCNTQNGRFGDITTTFGPKT